MSQNGSASVSHPIVGAWRLTAFTEQDLRTGAVTYPFGQQAKAFVVYTAKGYVATIFAAANRKSPVAAQASDQEATALYRSMIAFAGRYELVGEKLIYYPEISWNEAWNGTRQERFFQVSGNRLEVRSAPAISTLSGAETVFTLVWERTE